jgi:hypothetical protein
MFITLLAVTFFISLTVALIVVYIFGKPIENILHRIISDEISRAWVKYIKFAICVVGVSSGVRIWELERYITPPQYREGQIIELTRDRWILEVYRTIIGSLQGIAWLLLVFFIFALVAFVIVRVFELRKAKTEAGDGT